MDKMNVGVLCAKNKRRVTSAFEDALASSSATTALIKAKKIFEQYGLLNCTSHTITVGGIGVPASGCTLDNPPVIEGVTYILAADSCKNVREDVLIESSAKLAEYELEAEPWYKCQSLNRFSQPLVEITSWFSADMADELDALTRPA